MILQEAFRVTKVLNWSYIDQTEPYEKKTLMEMTLIRLKDNCEHALCITVRAFY